MLVTHFNEDSCSERHYLPGLYQEQLFLSLPFILYGSKALAVDSTQEQQLKLSTVEGKCNLNFFLQTHI